MRRLVWLLMVVLMGCDEASGPEKWELVMSQASFAITRLSFDEKNVTHAIGGDGTTLRRRAEWNAWVPLPSLSSVSRTLGSVIPRAWDANGNVYYSNGVIYRQAKGEAEWKLVPGSLGQTLVTVDPAGNTYATGSRGDEVLLAGSAKWVPSPPVTRVDANGRAYSGNQRLDGMQAVVDAALATGPAALFDAKGDVLEFANDETTMTVTRRTFASTQKTTLASFAVKPGLELLGCGLEGTCNFFLGPSAVFRARAGGQLEQIGDTATTSTNDALNFAGFALWVGADGLVYLSDVSGQTTPFSRVARLRPGLAKWPTEVSP